MESDQNNEPETKQKQQSAFLRINAEKVSELMDLMGELGLAANELIHHPEIVNLNLEEFWLAAHRLNLIIQETQDIAASLSLVPINNVFSRMRRLVRELASQTGKSIDLVLKGEDTEIDKSIVDSLYDPLVHIVRNSADHGLESDEERRAKNKSLPGKIILSATQLGTEIQITIQDDGKGLDRERILKKARERGLITEKDDPLDSIIWNFIFHPGFSTAETVSNLSGRGVGMDVVNSTITRLRGNINVHSVPDEGTYITLKIPMTMAFMECFVVRINNRLHAIPVDSVSEVFRPLAKQITHESVDNSEIVKVRENLIPVCRLQDFYEEHFEAKPLEEYVMVIVRSSHGSYGLPVDEILGQQQVTMKPLQGILKNIRAGSGCALLPSGEIAIALDCESLGGEKYA